MTNLKMIREEKGLSQSQLARASGVNVRMIQHYEQGQKSINKAQIGTVKALADALEVRMEEILE